MSRILNDLQDLRHNLGKILAKEDLQNEEEAASDLLKRLAEVTMTPDLITKSGLGGTVASLREKFKFSSEVSELSRGILLSWKTIMKTKGKTPAAPAPSKDSKAETKPSIPPVSFIVPKAGEAADPRKLSLPSERKAIYSIFLRLFKNASSSALSEKVALDAEEAIHNQSAGNHKHYSAKAKTLAFNLNKNKHLKDLVESGEVSASQLVELTAVELASSELKVKRDALTSKDLESRRLDWLDAHKQEIQADIGVDPNNSWQYDNEDDKLSEPDADQPDI